MEAMIRAVLALTLAAVPAGAVTSASTQAAQKGLKAQRDALRADVENLLSIVPAPDQLQIPTADQQRLGQDGLSQLKTAYKSKRAELTSLDAALAKSMTQERIQEAQQGFPQQKSDMLSLLFSATSSHYFDDQDRFLADKQAELDSRAALHSQLVRRGLSKKQLARIYSYSRQLGSLPDSSSIAKVYDAVGARPVLAQVPAAYVGTGSAPRASGQTVLSGVQVAQFKPYVRATPPAEPPSPDISLASLQPQTASASLLTRLINEVGDAKGRAVQVANAIVDRSRNLVDEKLEAAIVWAESAFNYRAKSDVGAGGLGQLMPGTARGLGVSNVYNIDQNVHGSAVFLRGLLDHFSSPDEQRYMNGLYAWGKTQVEQGRSISDVWNDVFQKTPLGIKNAIAAYNAGSGAIDYYAHGDYRQLPVRHTASAERNGRGYWQTIHYVPSVLHNYFMVVLKATPQAQPQLTAI